MKYLSQSEIDLHMEDLKKYYSKILFSSPAQNDTDKMYVFLNNYILYTRQNISQEWFNVISILKLKNKASVCNSVVKWNEVFVKKGLNKSLSMIYPKKSTKGIPVLIPAIKSFINMKNDTTEMELKWYKSYVYPIEDINIPPMFNYSTDVSIMERISLLGENAHLDYPVEVFNMVDYSEVNDFINEFLNDLINSNISVFRLEYTKREFKFFFELLKYSFVCCTGFYDSDDIEQCNGIPSTLMMKRHEDDVLLFLHDICAVVRKFTVFLVEKFNQYVDEEIVRQEKRKLKERANRNIRQRIIDAKELADEQE